ncbi:nucleotide exchange factor GrpE [Alphaproteobacteria bacterium]|nr:nucleotide exchange factor GrpE [Alphaproteobacteria bacterium]
MTDKKNDSEKNINQQAEEQMEEVDGSEVESSEEAVDEVAQVKDQLLRTMAELENTRKRAERENSEARKYAITGFSKDLLTVLDTLDRALESVPEEEKSENSFLKTICEGVDLTRGEMSKVLSKHKISKIIPKGEKFDHNFHQAVVEVPTDECDPGMVVDILQPGYIIEDRLLRPAMVTVSKKKD